MSDNWQVSMDCSSQGKDFKFFLCHQKSAAGSMARLLKIELEKKLPNTILGGILGCFSMSPKAL